MKIVSTALAGFVAGGSAEHLSSPYLFANPGDLSAQRIPTSYESAILARRILTLTPLATLSTVFPSSSSSSSSITTSSSQASLELDDASTLENRPPHMSGLPVGLMDYIADCEDTGNPTILAISIATTFKNVKAGSNISVSLNWVPPYLPDERIEQEMGDHNGERMKSVEGWLRRIWRAVIGKDERRRGGQEDVKGRRDPYAFSAANLPRFSLFGYLEPINLNRTENTAAALRECFVDKHPDARYWLPGNRIHESSWVRMVVTQVYWIGGFGDRAYIGWIPIDEWRNVTRDEWDDVRLPGEKKGWKEWSLPTETGPRPQNALSNAELDL